MYNKKRVIWSVIVVLIVLVVLLFLINYPKNCKSSDDCFSLRAKNCKLTKAELDKDGNTFSYEILGKTGSDCLVKVGMLKVAENQPADLKKALEGKDMECRIPQFLLQQRNIKVINNLNDYCTGQLKETILSITVEKLYEIVVKNIGNITLQLAAQKI